MLTDETDVDILWWVGCAGSYEQVPQQTSQAMARLLEGAGIRYAILGNQEKCCGSEARRLGEEGLFQQLAKENIKMFQRYNVRKVVVTCPHCYNTFKNEYPEFGADFEVVHHSEFLGGLITDGRLELPREASERVTFQDSCYLGRYNGLYDPPRAVLGSISGLQLVEMSRSRERGFCCGGGGGQMWLEGSRGERINYARLKDAENLNVQTLATACPFCKIMLDDAAGNSNSMDKIAVKDIAELILEAR
jgi:Fe-S oxidoreductase